MYGFQDLSRTADHCNKKKQTKEPNTNTTLQHSEKKALCEQQPPNNYSMEITRAHRVPFRQKNRLNQLDRSSPKDQAFPPSRMPNLHGQALLEQPPPILGFVGLGEFVSLSLGHINYASWILPYPPAVVNDPREHLWLRWIYDCIWLYETSAR